MKRWKRWKGEKVKGWKGEKVKGWKDGCFSCWKGSLAEVVPYTLYKLKTACRRQITSAFAWCCMWVACPATARTSRRKRTCFRCRWPLVRVYGILVLSSFNNKFNIVSVLFVHQPLTWPQKIDSREGWFWWKKGLAYECSKMNFYLKRPPFALDFGLFAAKYTAFCR